ncbi:MAG: cyclic nucleotide-binding and patatin-like phospholipase domain-containing protein, partial [Bryobacteraceae bacterium]
MTHALDEFVDFLCSTELFRGVSKQDVSELAPDFKVTTLEDGQVLVRQGESAHDLYVVLFGRLHVTVNNRKGESRLVFDVGPRESVGEMAILCQDSASATIVALGSARIAALSRTAFNRFYVTHPHAALLVTQSLSRRQQKHRISVALHLSELFETLPREALRDLEAELEMFSLYGGELLFRRGDTGDFVCMVISGRLRVVAGGDGRETSITEVGRGELVGDMEVVSGAPRSTTVEAVRDSQLAKLTKAAFDRFTLKHGKSAVEMVSRKVAERVRNTAGERARWRRSVATIAIVPAHSSAPKNEFAEGLCSALGQFGSTFHLTSDVVDEHFDQSGIAQTFERDGGNIRMVEWLNKKEFEHSYVLYETDPFLSPWTERCIRQADHVVILADGTANPAPGDIEAELLDPKAGRTAARQWLALMHRHGNPSNTKRWLDVRNVVRHFHLRPGDKAAFERMARLITGRGVGITLGGGFARGLAHVGVFRAFEDLGVAIDAVGGASMGAMVGALWAMGWEREKIIEETCRACSGAFGDLTFP